MHPDAIVEGFDVIEDRSASLGGGRIPSSAATLAALRPLTRHNQRLLFILIAVSRLAASHFDNVSYVGFSGFDLCPLSVKSMQPYS